MPTSSSKRLENLSVAIVPLTKAALALLSIRSMPKYFGQISSLHNTTPHP
jgi:hypothetical protein